MRQEIAAANHLHVPRIPAWTRVALAAAIGCVLASAAAAQTNSRPAAVTLIAHLQDDVGVSLAVPPARRAVQPGQLSAAPEQRAGYAVELNASLRLALGSTVRGLWRLETPEGRGELVPVPQDAAANEPPANTRQATGARTASNPWATLDPRLGRQQVAQSFFAVTEDAPGSVVRLTLVAF
jgi:hypothetical protein